MKQVVFCVAGASLALLVVSGCSTAHSGGRPERAYSRGELTRSVKQSGDLSLDNLMREYSDAKDEGSRRKARNKIIDTGMILIDANYGAFVDDLSSSAKGFNTASDVASISADVLATILGPASTKAIFAASSAAIEASQSVVNRNYVYEKTMPVLMSQMEAQRQSVAADLIKGTGMVTEAYPLAAALRDLERYYVAGTIDGSLAAVAAGAARQDIEATERIQEHQDQLQAKFEPLVRTEQNARVHIATHGDKAARSALAAWYESIEDDELRAEVNREAFALAQAQGLGRRALLRLNVLDADDPAFASYFDTKNYVLHEAKPEQVEALLERYADDVMLPKHE